MMVCRVFVDVSQLRKIGIKDFGFKIKDLGIEDLGFKIKDLGFKIKNLG
jgi:hypothetical protein